MAQMIESTLPLTMRPGYVSSANSASSPGSPGAARSGCRARPRARGFDEGHHRIERQAGDEAAGTKLQVDDVALAGRARRRLIEHPTWRSRAARGSARPARTCRSTFAPSLCCICPTEASACASVACSAACSLRAALALAGQLARGSPRPARVEAVAGAGLDELLVLLDALSRELEPARRPRSGRGVRLRDRGTRLGDLGVGALATIPGVSRWPPCAWRAAPRAC